MYGFDSFLPFLPDMMGGSLASDAPPRRKRYGAFLPSSWMGEEIPEDVSRRARSEGLLSLGAELLSSAPTGDFSVLGRGAAAFAGAQGQGLDRYLDESSRRKQQEQSERRLGIEESYAERAERSQRQEQIDRDRKTMAEAEERREHEERKREVQESLSSLEEQLPEERRAAFRNLAALDPGEAIDYFEKATGESADRFFQSGRHVARLREDGRIEPAYSFPKDDSGSAAPDKRNEILDNYRSEVDSRVRQETAALRARYPSYQGVPESELAAVRPRVEAEVGERLRRVYGAAADPILGAGEEGGETASDAQVVATAQAALARMPGMSTEELRQRLLEEVGGDAARVERLLAMIAGM